MGRPIFREAIEALEQLEIAEGRLAKEEILERHKKNKALQAIIKLALGTDRYYVRPGMNVVCISHLNAAESWKQFLALVKRLKHRELTGNAAKSEVARFLASCRPQLMKWYCRILNHDLRIGVDRLTVEKIWGDAFLLSKLAKTKSWRFVGYAKAKKFDDYVTPKRPLEFPVAIEAKLDGERAPIFCFPARSEIVVFTRSGRRRQTIEQVKPFRDQLIEFCLKLTDGSDKPIFLDGEFDASNWNKASSLVRRTRNFNQKEFLKGIKLKLWDWAPLDRYLAGSFDVRWVRRKSELQYAAGAKEPSEVDLHFSDNIDVLGHTTVYDMEQLNRAHDRNLDALHEGSILKFLDAPHVFKRTVYMLKIKPVDPVSGRILDVLPGKDKNAAVADRFRKAVRIAMKKAGPIKDNGLYVYCRTSKAEALVRQIKEVMHGDGEHRIVRPRDNVVGFRYGERLGRLVVELDNGDTVKVGGGFKDQQRDAFWLHRDELIGMYIDAKIQTDPQKVAAGRFNRFVRVREDL